MYFTLTERRTVFAANRFLQSVLQNANAHSREGSGRREKDNNRFKQINFNICNNVNARKFDV